MAWFLQRPIAMGPVRLILLALVVTQLADAATFTLGVSRYGIGLESNGIAAGLFGVGGLEAVLLTKGTVLIGTIALLVSTATRFPRLLVWGGAAATSLGLLGFAANTTTLFVLG